MKTTGSSDSWSWVSFLVLVSPLLGFGLFLLWVFGCHGASKKAQKERRKKSVEYKKA
ncbi:MAG: hypothetical protein WCV59_03115 [Parcubacteria group bacterium]|jgi:hypothetical protein